MRKGFTMIELIFVIVILGVLASVAIPRLAATRDDAEVAKAATNLTTAVSDITAYYTAKGKFSTGMSTKFNEITNALTKDGKLNVKGSTTCVEVKLPTTTANAQTTASNKVELKLYFGANGKEDAVCKQLRKLPGIMTMCGVDTTNNKTSVGTNSSDCKIQIGGSGGIQF
ncbi:putative type II secretion system protein [Candidatus Campylobacter infans]|uniref:Putative type II secretion system protein n=1 Tax=Candidatus Campylobacter infans TaxID=2561898 RepID=A0A7H9CEQ9_9BACT|nr:type II secretion system protein [Candidatus Campylobacter infans]QLI04593.1 putative type II secretion system protein [Candidatus Campylobacter infans]